MQLLMVKIMATFETPRHLKDTLFKRNNFNFHCLYFNVLLTVFTEVIWKSKHNFVIINVCNINNAAPF